MKVLVIPDVHLKPNMFFEASALMHQKIADKAVCLMDIADDWNQEYNVDLYEETYDAAIKFALDYPESLWCYGNHDLSYLWQQLESGYSSMASATVQKKLFELKCSLPQNNSMMYVQRIDNVVFSHGGILDSFVKVNVSSSQYDNVDDAIDAINQLGENEMWSDSSPIWLRPQYSEMSMFRPQELLQVVGHTPVESISKDGNIISCDVFSTYRNGDPIGTEEFLVLDTVTWEFMGIKH